MEAASMRESLRAEGRRLRRNGFKDCREIHPRRIWRRRGITSMRRPPTYRPSSRPGQRHHIQSRSLCNRNRPPRESRPARNKTNHRRHRGPIPQAQPRNHWPKANHRQQKTTPRGIESRSRRQSQSQWTRRKGRANIRNHQQQQIQSLPAHRLRNHPLNPHRTTWQNFDHRSSGNRRLRFNRQHLEG